MEDDLATTMVFHDVLEDSVLTVVDLVESQRNQRQEDVLRIIERADNVQATGTSYQ